MGKKSMPSSMAAPRPWTSRIAEQGTAFINAEGTRLARTELRPKEVIAGKPPKGFVFFCHGAAEYSLRNKELLQSLVDRGFVVVTHDHLGFGRSHGSIRGDLPKPYMYTRDVLEDFEQSRTRYPGVKSFVVGLSLGGMMAAQVAASTTVHGAVLIAPAIVIDPRTASPAKICLAHCLVKCCPLTGVAGINPEYFTHDQEKLDDFLDDDLVFHGKARARWAVNLLKEVIEVEHHNIQKVTAPLLILQGSDDKVCNEDGAKLAMDRAASEDKTHIVYKDLYHDLLNEVKEDRQRVYQDIGDWLESQVDGESRPLTESGAARLGTGTATKRGHKRRMREKEDRARAAEAAATSPAEGAEQAQATKTKSADNGLEPEPVSPPTTSEVEAATGEAPGNGSAAVAAEPAAAAAEPAAEGEVAAAAPAAEGEVAAASGKPASTDEASAAEEPPAPATTPAALPKATTFGLEPPSPERRLSSTAV